MYCKVIAILLGLSSVAHAHEMVPAYPVMDSSYVPGISVATMSIFNRRNDVSYYEIGVFTEDWESVTFATSDRVIHLDHLQRKNFQIYISNKDLKKATYICTLSKLKKDEVQTTGISSKICSKIK